jgi:hypothetical protein
VLQPWECSWWSSSSSLTIWICESYKWATLAIVASKFDRQFRVGFKFQKKVRFFLGSRFVSVSDVMLRAIFSLMVFEIVSPYLF